MKKAQILSALALAFALGVAVIPAADTYAAFVKDENGIDVTDTETVDKVKAAIEKGKESCGWHLDTETNTKVYYYRQYVTLSEQLDKSAEDIEAAEKAQFTDLESWYETSITNFETTLAGLTPAATLPANVAKEFTDNIKTYDQAVVFINNNIAVIKRAIEGYNANEAATTVTAMKEQVNNMNAKLVSVAETLDDAKDAEAEKIEDLIVPIAETKKDEDITYAEAVKKANALTSTQNGTCSVAKVNNLKKAIDYAQSLLDSDYGFGVADADKAIAAIVKAQNGGTITDIDTPNKPSDGTGDDQNKAPNTGALTNTEGSASTTVAMVAGIATALTAAGAGVVAYRNARRSTRK